MSSYQACYGENNQDERCRPPYPPLHHYRFPVTILSCGNGAGGSLPVNNIEVAPAAQAVIGSYGSPSLIIATVSLDTNGLDHPEVKIDFSSLINFRADFLSGYTLQLVFQLSRSCNHGPKTTLATWTYENDADAFLDGIPIPSEAEVKFEFNVPFGFVWCQCNDCPGCCLYTVEVVDVSSYGVECASITNVGITAIASGKPEC